MRKALMYFAIVIVAVSIHAQPGPPSGPPQQPQVLISSTTADYSFTVPRLMIFGINFQTTVPAVTLNGVALNVVTYTTTSITAELPTLPTLLAPGSYLLHVSFGNAANQQDSFDCTLGAVGPQGPKGDPGATGPAGPIGPQGAEGPQGPQGRGFTFRSEYSPGNSYAAYDVVTYNGTSYVANVDIATVETSPGEPAWSVIASKGDTGSPGPQGAEGPVGLTGQTGPAGPQGAVGPIGPQGLKGDVGATGSVGMKWQGGWSPSSIYALNDAVSYNGSTYISTAQSNVGNAPETSTGAWSLLAGGSATPTGVVQAFAGGNHAPSGYLMCDGSAVSRTTYAVLFAVIGIGYGAGDGSTTFNLPDLRGRVAMGSGQGPGLSTRFTGQRLGEETHLLTIAEMPAHVHDTVLAADGRTSWGLNPNTKLSIFGSFWGVSLTAQTAPVGGNQPYSNIQPSLVLDYIIKY